MKKMCVTESIKARDCLQDGENAIVAKSNFVLANVLIGFSRNFACGFRLILTKNCSMFVALSE